MLYPFEYDANGDLNDKTFPAAVWNLKRLRVLKFHCFEHMDSLPGDIGGLSELEEILSDNGNGCAMNIRLPGALENLKKLRVLRLYGAVDARIFATENREDPRSQVKPVSLSGLTALEILDLGRNGITGVPPQIAGLSRLRSLGLSFNDLDSVPDFVGRLPKLRVLDVQANNHIRLPRSLEDLDSLHLILGNNDLTIADQEELRKRFPRASFDFVNEYDDGRANEESPEILAQYAKWAAQAQADSAKAAARSPVDSGAGDSAK